MALSPRRAFAPDARPAAAALRHPALLFLTAALAAAAARGEAALEGRPAGGAVALGGGAFALRLPARPDFASPRPAPLARVRLGAVSLAPEGGGDVRLVLGADSAGRLRLRRWRGGAAAAGGGLPLAWAGYSSTVAQNGWAHLAVKVTSDPRVSDGLKMYAAGWLEGFASARQIRDFQHSAGGLTEKDEALDGIRESLAKELQTICTKAGAEANGTAPPQGASRAGLWWQHAGLMLMQAWGMLDAFNLNAARVNGTPMSMLDLFVLSGGGGTPHVEAAPGRPSRGGARGAWGGARAALLQERRRAAAGQQRFPDVADEAYHFEETVLRRGELGGCEEGGDCDEEDDDNATDGGGAGAVLLQGRRLRTTRRSPARRGARPARGPAAREPAGAARGSARGLRSLRRGCGRCAALVRLAPNASDVLVGHSTLSEHGEASRIFKHYDFPLRGSPSRRMSFSSHPGGMGSDDGFYIVDTGLVVAEATASTPSGGAADRGGDGGSAVPDHMRTVLASRLAETGRECVELLAQGAAGTRGGQWAVVDYKAFRPGSEPQDGTLWVLERAHGAPHAEDMTAHLRRAGFWASLGGADEARGLDGGLFSASRSPRASTFAETALQVASLADLRAEMLQRSRWPQEAGEGPDSTLDHAAGPMLNGVVDTKVTSACLAKELAVDALSSPVRASLPPPAAADGWARLAPDGEAAGPRGRGAAAEGCLAAPPPR